MPPDNATAPGWYPDANGWLRWWDGAAWGPFAPPPAGKPDSLTWGTLAHLGFIVGWFIGPLIVRQTVGRRDEFVRKHATEAVNANLTLALYWNLGPLLAWGLVAGTGDSSWESLYFGAGLAFVWILVTAIRGSIAANRGEPYRYPVIIRFVRGGWPRAPR